MNLRDSGSSQSGSMVTAIARRTKSFWAPMLLPVKANTAELTIRFATDCPSVRSPTASAVRYAFRESTAHR